MGTTACTLRAQDGKGNLGTGQLRENWLASLKLVARNSNSADKRIFLQDYLCRIATILLEDKNR